MRLSNGSFNEKHTTITTIITTMTEKSRKNQQQFALIHSIVATVALMFCLAAFVGCGSNGGENVVFAQGGIGLIADPGMLQPDGVPDEAAAAPAGGFWVPPAPIERWEYKVVVSFGPIMGDIERTAAGRQEQLNELGAEGWELFKIEPFLFYLKRRSP